MHPSKGEIRAYLDQALSATSSVRLQTHLLGCSRCQARANEMQKNKQLVKDRFDALQLNDQPVKLSPAMARSRLSSRLTGPDMEVNRMMKILYRIPRAAWATLAVVAILAVALTFAPVRTLANSFLGLFRVEQIRVVEIDATNLEQKMGDSSQLETLFTENVKFEQNGEPQEVANLAEATALAGFSARLPGAFESPSKLVVEPGGRVSFKVDLSLVQAVLKEIGRSDIVLPAALDGADVSVEVPAGLMAAYGECSRDQAPQDPDEPNLPLSECTIFSQIPSPSVQAPPGLDLSQLGEAYMQILGMSPEEAASFARNVDWTTTFVVPIPRYGAEYSEVPVDGVKGTLIMRPNHEYLLVWVKDGIIYALTGQGKKVEALDIAATIK